MPGKVDRPETTAAFDATRLIATNQRAVRAAIEAQSHGFRRMAQIGSSVFDFVQRRLKHDSELAQRLGTAKTPEDAYGAYHDFFDTAVREYSGEFSALADLYADQTKETMQATERQVKEFARPTAVAE